MERDVDREGARRADPGPDRVSGANGNVAPGWLVLLYNGMALGVLINSIAGVSLNTDRLEAFKDRLETLKAAYRGE